MSFGAVDLAAWIVIWVIGRREVYEIFGERAARLTRLAVEAEFADAATSESRRAALLTRYSETLVKAPCSKYLEIAKEQDRSSKISLGQEIIWTFFMLVVGGVLWGLIHFGWLGVLSLVRLFQIH